MRVLLTLLSLMCLSARAASAQEAPLTEPTTPAAAALCASFKDADPVSKDACLRSCTRWPIDTSCSILRRFGYDGWAAGGDLIHRGPAQALIDGLRLAGIKELPDEISRLRPGAHGVG